MRLSINSLVMSGEHQNVTNFLV